MKYVFFVLTLFVFSGCAQDSDEKYDLKSPCVSADTSEQAPCQRRVPVNQNVS